MGPGKHERESPRGQQLLDVSLPKAFKKFQSLRNANVLAKPAAVSLPKKSLPGNLAVVSLPKEAKELSLPKKSVPWNLVVVSFPRNLKSQLEEGVLVQGSATLWTRKRVSSKESPPKRKGIKKHQRKSQLFFDHHLRSTSHFSSLQSTGLGFHH